MGNCRGKARVADAPHERFLDARRVSTTDFLRELDTEPASPARTLEPRATFAQTASYLGQRFTPRVIPSTNEIERMTPKEIHALFVFVATKRGLPNERNMRRTI